MLNLKKGLAIALAAATALTFAPVSTLTAKADNAGYGSNDGYSYTSHIDSINFKSFDLTNDRTVNADVATLPAVNTAFAKSQAKSGRVVLLKEHNDNSNVDTTGVGTKVAGFRITIEKPLVKGSTTKHANLVTVVGADTGYDPADTSKPFWKDAGNKLLDETDASWDRSDDSTKAVYTIANKDGAPGADATKAYTVNGAPVGFVALNLNGTKLEKYSVKVTVEALSNLSTQTVLDSSEFTINVPQKDQQFILDTQSKYTVSEGDDVVVPYHFVNDADTIDSLKVTYSPYSNADQTTSDIAETKSADLRTYGSGTSGTVKIHAKQRGEVVVTVHAVKKDKTDLAAPSFTIVVTPGNGKLRVSYDTAYDSRFKGQNYTFTDDVEDSSSTLSGVVTGVKGRSETVDATGSFKIFAKPQTNDDGYIKDLDSTDNSSSKYYFKASTGEADTATNTISADPVDAATQVSQLKDASEQAKIGYTIDNIAAGENENIGVLPEARTLTNGENTTLQIDASSDSNADVSYALVAPSLIHDAAVGKPSGTTTEQDTADWAYNPVTNSYLGSFDNYDQNNNKATTDADRVSSSNVQVKSKVAAGDYYEYTTAAAKKYGAIDNNGLVTLKSTSFDVPLYVVVTAKRADATATAGARKTSTFIIPINISDNKELSFYASSENGYADVDLQGVSSLNAIVEHHIYLSDDHKSDKLVIDTNAGANYVTGSVSDTAGKFTYNNGVVSATSLAKPGDSTKLTLKTSSAPGISGTASVTFTVDYTGDKSTNSLTLSDAAVSKDSPRDKVESTPGVAGSTVIFDKTLYKKDSSRQNGYSEIKSKEHGAADVAVTSTGWVTYQKNDGELYVRAYAKADGYNPTGYVYAKVTYGQNATPNDLTVQEDRVIVKPGEKASVHATASNAISFAIDDTSVATVASAGAIEVTGVKTGNTTLKVTAAANAKTGTPEKTISIPVFVSDEDVAPVVYKNPAQVKGVKIGNKKGAKVVVKFNKDTTSKNIKYYVQKKVGKKTSGKSVGSNRTILSVKKGATVKVRVKAYYYDANGVKHVGKYSKWVTKKTDKK